MVKGKTIKAFLVLGALLFSIAGGAGCSSDKKAEKENKEMVSFPIQHYSAALSSVSGQPILLTLEEASFTVSIEKGSFEFYNEVKEKSVNSGDTFFYCPIYKSNDSTIIVQEEIFVDIKVLMEEEIVGYGVVKINYDNSAQIWEPELIVSNLFIDKEGKIVSVNENYANDRIQDYHK
ncbi:MAG: hypothetical protein IJ308_02475 [Clostridia bacterium]|nr:hypothetical protein [Clostridia bacterium]